jgi:putative flippase GtrA
MQRVRRFLEEFTRYGIVGVLRTVVGIAMLYILPEVLGLPYILSNIIVYAIGLSLGFILHKGWAFRSNRPWKSEVVPYAVSFALAYAANLLTVVLMVEVFRVGKTLSQGTGMAVFIAINYLANKLWTFRASHAGTQ